MDELLTKLIVELPDLIVNGSLEHRLANNINISIPGIDGDQLHKALRSKISCSSGSACSNGALSHVLLALGRTSQEAKASLRLSLGRDTNEEQINQLASLL